MDILHLLLKLFITIAFFGLITVFRHHHGALELWIRVEAGQKGLEQLIVDPVGLGPLHNRHFLCRGWTQTLVTIWSGC